MTGPTAAESAICVDGISIGFGHARHRLVEAELGQAINVITGLLRPTTGTVRVA